MSECMLKKLLFAVKRRRKVNHSSSHAVYSGIEEQSRLMDGGGRKSGIKRPIQAAAERRFCLTLRASETACPIGPTSLSGEHTQLQPARLPSLIFCRRTFGFRHITRCTTPLTVRRRKMEGKSADRLALKEILSNKFHGKYLRMIRKVIFAYYML